MRSTTGIPLTGDISSDDIGILLQMKHDERIIQALLGRALQDERFLQLILEKAKDFEYGITSHGDLCANKCGMGENDEYFKCNKKAGGVLERSWDFCSPEEKVTHQGKVA